MLANVCVRIFFYPVFVVCLRFKYLLEYSNSSFFFCYIKCSPIHIHIHVMLFFHFTDVFIPFSDAQKSEGNNDKKAHEKMFAVRKLKGNTLEYFTFYRRLLFVLLCLHFCLQSEYIIKGKNLTKRLCTFFHGKKEEMRKGDAKVGTSITNVESIGA